MMLGYRLKVERGFTLKTAFAGNPNSTTLNKKIYLLTINPISFIGTLCEKHHNKSNIEFKTKERDREKNLKEKQTKTTTIKKKPAAINLHCKQNINMTKAANNISQLPFGWLTD